MILLYNFSISALATLYRIASWFNPKAKAFVTGRREQRKKISASFAQHPGKLVWIHCASLGEFEQGRPVLEAIKSMDPSIKILLTFFSPSGFEVRKNYELADWVYYLPWDTARNARSFVESVKPDFVIFVKYEFWYHYAHEIKKKNIPLISISTIFRNDQVFFKWYGSLFRSILKCFDHFFVQNQNSLDLLKSINIKQATITGDTRFDRVHNTALHAQGVPFISEFKNDQKLMVVGSAWQEDMEVLYPFINDNANQLKFIVAPHEISESFLKEIESSVSKKCVRYSMASRVPIEDYSIILIDNVGMLGGLYQYSEFAFVGGGFKQGLHNILEAACFGIPIFFGDRAFQKYQEAVDLILRGGAFEVGDYNAFKTSYELLNNYPESFLLACEVTKQYVLENLGASEKIINYSKKYLS